MSRKPDSLDTSRLLLLATWNLALQASYDPARRQALGVAAAMASCAGLWPLEEDRKSFFMRHLEPMNTNPAMAGPLLGAMARWEERAAVGEERALPRITQFRRLLEGPLAALGDALLWAGLRPAGGLAGSVIAWSAGALGPIFFLLLYNLVHLSLRCGGVFWGYRRADNVQEILRARWLRLLRAGLPWVIHIAGLILVAEASGIDSPARWTLFPAAVLGVYLGRRGAPRGGYAAGGAIMVGLLLALAATFWTR